MQTGTNKGLMGAFHIHIVLYPDATHTTSRDTHIPQNIFNPLPSHSSSSAQQKAKARTEKAQDPHLNDYRRGPISIDWLDFDRMSSSVRDKDPPRGPAEATFVPSRRKKSGITNLPEGVVHVYRSGSSSNKPPPDDTAKDNDGKEEEGEETDDLPIVDDADGITLGVLAVPSWMTPSDFLAFVAPAEEGISHLRIIRDFAPNRSIVLIKFYNPGAAAEFIEAYNGKPFNSMEPEICHVVHVLSVVIDVEDSVSQAIARLSSTQGPSYELPTCPVCLERMDSAVTGLITVPCSHTFHCMCLSKWGDSRCPVCRYSQTLLTSHPTSSSSSTHPRSTPFSDPTAPLRSSCNSCASTTNLWICLICGNIGCGRYGQAHAHSHYQQTTHLYALELETQRVWDYAGDGYVHRLIQNKADGKLVELPSAAASMSTGSHRDGGGGGPSQADALTAEKIEAIGIEYSYLLTSQLDSQREYYESQDASLRSELEQLKVAVHQLSDDFAQSKKRHEEELKAKEEEKQRALEDVRKENAKAQTKLERMTELARKLDKELKEERAVSDGLMRNLNSVKATLVEKEKEKEQLQGEVRELQEQVRDVMFSLDASRKIELGGGVEAEAAGGSIGLQMGGTESAASRLRRLRGR